MVAITKKVSPAETTRILNSQSAGTRPSELGTRRSLGMVIGKNRKSEPSSTSWMKQCQRNGNLVEAR